MNEVIEIFMRRDGMTKREAVERFKELRKEVAEILQEGGGYNEVEDLLLGEMLEMDYAFYFI